MSAPAMLSAVTIEQMLDEARAGLRRLSPAEARDAASRADGVIVDIRERERRVRDGLVPGAVVIERNVLEWRCAPECEWRDERVSGADQLVILMCNEGYQSSLAAAALQRLGLRRATDITGGFEAWLAARLPVER